MRNWALLRILILKEKRGLGFFRIMFVSSFFPIVAPFLFFWPFHRGVLFEMRKQTKLNYRVVRELPRRRL